MSRGFSLLECVVASVLCAAGVMALAAGSRSSMDLALLGSRTAGAASVAAARLATLRGTACGGAREGDAAAGIYREQWSVVGPGIARLLIVDVTFDLGGRPRTLRWQSELTCPAA